jgi:hypothetical protein
LNYLGFQERNSSYLIVKKVEVGEPKIVFPFSCDLNSYPTIQRIKMLPSIFLKIHKKQGNYALISGKLIFSTFPFLRFLKDSATIEE